MDPMGVDGVAGSSGVVNGHAVQQATQLLYYTSGQMSLGLAPILLFPKSVYLRLLDYYLTNHKGAGTDSQLYPCAASCSYGQLIDRSLPYTDWNATWTVGA